MRRSTARRPTAPRAQYGSHGWTVARHPATDHAYLVQYQGTDVGWVYPTDTGWRWLLTWSVRPLRYGRQRTSRTSYRGFAAAVAALARTDVGRHTTATKPGTDWQPLTDRTPWQPTPDPAEQG